MKAQYVLPEELGKIWGVKSFFLEGTEMCLFGEPVNKDHDGVKSI